MPFAQYNSPANSSVRKVTLATDSNRLSGYDRDLMAQMRNKEGSERSDAPGENGCLQQIKAGTFRYLEADREIFLSGVLPSVDFAAGSILMKCGIGYLQMLMTLELRKKLVGGTLFVVFASSQECQVSLDAYEAHYAKTILLDGEGRGRGSFKPAFSNAVERVQSDGVDSLVLTTLDTVCHQVPDFSQSDVFVIRKGERMDVSALCGFLEKIGYVRVPFVRNGGDFSVFGEVVDVFPAFSDNPSRIYLDFDTAEKITAYDVVTGDNLRDLDYLRLQGAVEEEGSVVPFTKLIRENDALAIMGSERILLFSSGQGGDGDEERMAFKKWIEANRDHIRLEFLEVGDGRGGAAQISGARQCPSFPSFGIFKKEALRLLELGWRIRIFCKSLIRRERIRALLDIGEKTGADIRFEDVDAPKGFYLDEGRIAIFCADGIFNKRERSSAFTSLQTHPITDLASLRVNDFVVHSQNGIGRFVGFDKIEMLGRVRDYIKIEYADKEFFYVPLERADTVEKYIGSENVRLDRLHSASWANRRKKALESARLFADRLLKTYALRKIQKGFSHLKDTSWQMLFEEGFENEETDDQLRAIEDVKRDMESPSPMDRIICGDVGFGKTEVAFRACFKAIMSGKQVCFLAPTTILVAQHCRNFKKRCADFPIRIEELSRIRSGKDAKAVISALRDGSCDIVFATHKGLQDDVKFMNLGLLVVDEEQRFGVRDKERIKTLKANIDTLTLTATPIPRTLYMGLLGLKDVSLLQTPPKLRQQTDIIIRKYDERLVSDAIASELGRGGQVFFLHNDTSDILKVRERVQRLFPDAIVDFMHGKMRSREIERSIGDFANGRTDVLVSTTIIENGIDVPNANTLIVDNATVYGTSQLYQIKGRVGRSTKKAIAYLLYPEKAAQNPNAIARLKVISENKTLGSGFNIAMNDLAMRGGGNILSKEQSGHIAEVGLDMYMRLLDLCVRRLEKGEESQGDHIIEDDFEVSVNMPYVAFVPDSYITESEVKFRLYKQLANAKDEDEITAVMTGIEIRYGTAPPPLLELYRLNLIKILCKSKRISGIGLSADGKTFSFAYEKARQMNADRITALIRTMPGRAWINRSNPNQVVVKCEGGEGGRMAFALDIVRKL